MLKNSKTAAFGFVSTGQALLVLLASVVAIIVFFLPGQRVLQPAWPALPKSFYHFGSSLKGQKTGISLVWCTSGSSSNASIPAWGVGLCFHVARISGKTFTKNRMWSLGFQQAWLRKIWFMWTSPLFELYAPGSFGGTTGNFSSVQNPQAHSGGTLRWSFDCFNLCRRKLRR